MSEFTLSALNAMGVELVPRGGLNVFRVSNRLAVMEITGHGAHVLSYTPAGQSDLLWVSKQSLFQPGKPIRGGIPVCWPWFGGAGTPAHGIARIAEWTLEDCRPEADGSTTLTFSLDTTGVNGLTARLTVNAGTTLTVSLTTHNAGQEAFRLTEALHTYFAVAEAEKIRVDGLDGCAYIDTVAHSENTQNGLLRVVQETDLQFFPNGRILVIEDPVWGRKIRMERLGSASTVVWNPWIEKSKRMADFGDDEYHGMICAEAANIGTDAQVIPPGGSHTLTTRLSLC